MRWSIPIRRKRSKRASSNWWKVGESRQRHGGILEVLVVTSWNGRSCNWRSQFHRVFTLLHFLHCGSFWIVLVRLASILSMHVCILACCRAPLPSWWVYLPILSVSSSRPSWISIAGHHASRPKLTGRLRSIYKPYAYIYTHNTHCISIHIIYSKEV